LLDIFKVNTNIEHLEVDRIDTLTNILEINNRIKSASITNFVNTTVSDNKGKLLRILKSNIVALDLPIYLPIIEEVLQLTCLKSLKISSCNITTLTQSDLEIISKQNPNMLSLDISCCLPDIVIPLFPKLETLSINTFTFKQLSNLNAWKLKSLTVVEFNTETSIAMFQYLKETKSLRYLKTYLPKIETLYMSVPALQGLAENKSLTELHLISDEMIKDEYAIPILKLANNNVKNLITCSLPAFSDYVLEQIENCLDENRSFHSNIVWTLFQDPSSYFYSLPPEVVAIVAQYLTLVGLPMHRRNIRQNSDYGGYRLKLVPWNFGLSPLQPRTIIY